MSTAIIRSALVISTMAALASPLHGQKRPPESDSGEIQWSCRRGGNAAIYGRAVGNFDLAVGYLTIQRVPPGDCLAFGNERGWWFIGNLEPGHHVFDVAAPDWCAPEPIEVDLQAGDTIRIDTALLLSRGYEDTVIPQAPPHDVLECLLEQRRWKARLGLGASVPDSWRLPTEREMLLAVLATPPVQALVRILNSDGPVPVEYRRPWRESLETVAGREFRVAHSLPPQLERSPRPAYLVVSPMWIDAAGFRVYVAVAPPLGHALDVRFARTGDDFVYCRGAPERPECSK